MGFNFISSDPLANPIIGRSLAHTTLYPGIHHSWVVSISLFFFKAMRLSLSYVSCIFKCSLSLSFLHVIKPHLSLFLKENQDYFQFLPASLLLFLSLLIPVAFPCFPFFSMPLSLPPCLPPTSCLCLFHRSLLDRTDPSDWMHCSVGVNRKTVKHLDLLASCKTCQMQRRIPKNFIFPT